MSFKLSLLVASILTILVLVSTASALTFTPGSITLSAGTNTKAAVLTNNDGFNLSQISFATSQPAGVTFSITGRPSTLDDGATAGLNISASGISSLAIGRYTATLVASGSNSSANATSGTLNVYLEKGSCSSGSVGGNLSIDRVRITSTGSDEKDWKPLDEITIEVRVSNNNNVNSMREVYAEIGLINDQGSNDIGSMKFNNTGKEKISLGTISKNSDKTATFDFIVPADFNFNAGSSYELVVKAYSDNLGENNECTDRSDDLDNKVFDSISIDRESEQGKYIAFVNNQLSSDQATCGDAVTLTTKVFNVGDSDQDSVTAMLANKALGINLKQDIRSGLKTGDDKLISFDFVVPQNLKDGTYNLELTAGYSDGISDSPTYVPIQVLGCALPTPEQIGLVSVSTESGQAGNSVDVPVTITNTGTNSATFVVGASGFDSWATLGSISDRIVSLAPGESKQVTITLNLNKDATGDKTFSVDVLSGSQNLSKSATVSVTKAAGSIDFSNLFQGNNGLLWIIAIVNIVLIIVIIIVAVKVARR